MIPYMVLYVNTLVQHELVGYAMSVAAKIPGSPIEPTAANAEQAREWAPVTDARCVKEKATPKCASINATAAASVMGRFPRLLSVSREM